MKLECFTDLKYGQLKIDDPHNILIFNTVIDTGNPKEP